MGTRLEISIKPFFQIKGAPRRTHEKKPINVSKRILKKRFLRK